MTSPLPKTADTPEDPIRKSVTVPLPPDAAFELFTDGIDRWWPKETHSLTSSDADGSEATVEVEPRVGGHVTERAPDGTLHPWATVTAWEPGRLLTLDWYVGRPETEATQVEVRFTPVDTGTRVDLTHGGFAAHGSSAATSCAGYTSGWEHVLGHCFGSACAAIAA